MPTQPSSNSQIYEHVRMLHPDGQLMCRTSMRRAQWFLQKNLASWVIKDIEFQLNFVPAGYGKSDIPYYTVAHQNRCVVCGVEHNLNKHHVFPTVFRKNMPLLYKSSNSFDVLPICIDCHEIYENEGNKLKEQIVQEYLGRSTIHEMTESQKKNIKIIRARNFIASLDENEQIVRQNKTIKPPKDVIEQYKRIASQELYETADSAHWGKQVMDIVLRNQEEQAFVEKWRKHFVETMNPQFLPEYWSVDHLLEKTTKIRQNVKLNDQDYKFMHMMQLA